ncbi:MAG: VCBS repeat-containing protein [Planctomycetales bacterium]|nr:VCBS repeat-containing protein [Planctomycetales bacterium]
MVNRLSRIKLCHEQLEIRRALSATRMFEPHQIDLTTRDSIGLQARSTYAADIDGDGDLDVFSASRTQGLVAWHENIDGKGTFSAQRHLIAGTGNPADLLLAADLDGDNAPDLIYASSREGKIAWYENLGAGTFSDAHVIDTVATSLISIATGDIDADGDPDVLVAASGDNTIAWYENGGGSFGTQQVVTDQAIRAMSVTSADLDHDGDLDILAASAGDDALAWYENLDGSGTFGDRKLIATPDLALSHANFASAADLDGDGDLDVLANSYGSHDSTVSWYENLDGQGTFGPRQQLMTGLFRHGRPRIDTVLAADLDSDGDLDVVTADEFNHYTFWNENLGGHGAFAAPQPIGPFTELTGGSFEIVDMDADGDLDLLSASDHEGIIAWHENRLIGDSNDDGIFDAADLILVFQAGEYLDGIAGNSTFAEGDWNLDGDFTSADIVLAFQAGTYSSPNQPSLANVSAAVDHVFARPRRRDAIT